jgi:acyl-coenzyme A thioesterase PaaI-like protein
MGLQLPSLFAKAQRSALHRRLLSFGLSSFVPFNRAHGFSVQKVEPYAITVRLPYKRSNFNHLKGLHACALATLAELTSGVLLLAMLDPSRYRLILKSLKVEYHMQGRSHAFARFEASPEWMKLHVLDPLHASESVFVMPEVQVLDAGGQVLCTAYPEWQIKDWKAVKSGKQSS